MKLSEIQVGGRYAAKVSGKVQVVRVRGTAVARLVGIGA